MSEPIVTLRFTVANPVSVNAAYGTRKSKKGGRGQQYLRKEAGSFKWELSLHALRAATTTEADGSFWPSNPWRVVRARISYQIYNSRLDADAPRKLIRDAFEGVLYVNDRIVSDGPSDPPIMDGKGRRVEVVAELLEIRSEIEARDLQRATESAAAKRRVTRDRKKAKDAAKQLDAGTSQRRPLAPLPGAVPKVRPGIPR